MALKLPADQHATCVASTHLITQHLSAISLHSRSSRAWESGVRSPSTTAAGDSQPQEASVHSNRGPKMHVNTREVSFARISGPHLLTAHDDAWAAMVLVTRETGACEWRDARLMRLGAQMWIHNEPGEASGLL